MARRVTCIPSADAAFGDAARTALDELDGHYPIDAIGPMLADVLRDAFPLVEVHRQDPLARIDGTDVWYAYRDGKSFADKPTAASDPQAG
jgi:hypothetical protein